MITHGVGPMRRYCLGAMLLDLDDPTKVLKRLEEPLLSPQENEREGYVPNVVYSCGSILHNGEIFIPYGISDEAARFATVSVDTLVGSMVAVEGGKRGIGRCVGTRGRRSKYHLA